MKTIKLLFYIVSLVLISSFSYGQSWDWAAQATYINNKGNVANYHISSDSKKNIYEAGAFTGTAIFGSDTLINTNRYFSTYLIKYDSARHVKWAKKNGLESALWQSIGLSTATDKHGNTYLCGDFGDTVTFGSYTLVAPTAHDIYLVKYDSSGNLLWATCGRMANGFSQLYCGQIALDNNGSIYISGEFYDTVRLGSFTLFSGSAGIFLTKYDSNGNVVWAKSGYSPSNHNPINGYATGAQTDNAGNIYVAGDFEDTIIFNPDTFKTNITFNVFLAKYNPAGNIVWIKTGSVPKNSSVVYAQAETVDNTGNIYISGRYHDTANFGSHQLLANGRYETEAYIVKYDSAGNIIWATNSSASKVSPGLYPYSMCADKFNNIYLSGDFSDTIQFGTVLLKSDSSNPSFLFQFDSTGKALCGTVLNIEYDIENSIAPIAGNSGVYFGSDLVYYPYCFLGPDTVSLPYGMEVPFIAKWKPGNTSTITITASSDSICPNELVTITAKGLNNGATYLWSPGGATSSSITVSPASTQQYTVTAIQGAFTYKDSITITVIPLPKPIISGTSSVCIGSRDTLYVSGGATYKWCNGSTRNSYITGLIYTDSTFCVTAYNILGCSVIDTFRVDTISCSKLGTNEIIKNSAFEIFPNPGNGVFTIQLSVFSGQCSVEVYNVLGEKVYSEALRSTQGDNTINLSDQPNGIYLYRVITETGNLVGEGKAVIER